MAVRMSSLVDRMAAAVDNRAAAAGGWGAGAEACALLDLLRAEHRPAGGDTASLHRIAGVFDLDPLDSHLLEFAAAPDLDARVAAVYALLRGARGMSRADVGLLLELGGIAAGSPAAFQRLGAAGRLIAHRLIEIPDADPWLARPVRVPDPVLATLADADPADPLVRGIRTNAVPLRVEGSQVVERAVESGVPLIWVTSAAGGAGLSLAAGAFDALDLRVLSVDLRLHSAPEPLVDVVAAATREAGLLGAALLIAGAELLAEPGARGALAMLDRAAVPIVAVSTRQWNPAWSRRLPLLVEADRLSLEDRGHLWESNIGEFASEDTELQQTLLGLRLTPEAVLEAARYARVLSTAQDQPLSATILREAARRVSGSGSSTTDRVVPNTGSDRRPTFEDLILPDTAASSLRRLVSWARHRDQVTASGLVPRSGRGIAALFAGSPGTGKTLAANVVAEELSVELLQVDVSAVVDKYIGETEKNLERVFQTAEALDVVLFFDEADALFGSRSEVRDSRDRYANQEIAYLLQRMEQFDGITILATNLRGNLDRAFSRRMSFIINFPDPDAPTRRLLWQHHLDQLAAVDGADPVNLDFLADTAELAGGDIRNIVLAAAYDAVADREIVGMRHLVEATLREYRKLGRVIPEHGFVPPAALRDRKA